MKFSVDDVPMSMLEAHQLLDWVKFEEATNNEIESLGKAVIFQPLR